MLVQASSESKLIAIGVVRLFEICVANVGCLLTMVRLIWHSDQYVGSASWATQVLRAIASAEDEQ
jgi:hypothetical protein